MKHETILDKDRQKFLYKAIESYKAGECVQDKFLGMLCDKMRGCSYGMKEPKLIYSTNKYNFVENYRRIIDKDGLDKIVYAYFDHPLMESQLYVATFDDAVKRQLLGTIREINPDFRMTPINQSPITIKVSMDLLCSSKELQIAYWDKQTLRYLDPPILSTDNLFDVVDMNGMSAEFLESIR